jgi:hypothetical protein
LARNGRSMIQVLQSWKHSPEVPAGWQPAAPPGAVIKDPVKNRQVLRALQDVLPGSWCKVYRKGADGTEIHYFQHASGKVALVKHKRKRR